jgi:hypothetical protein
MPFPTEFPRDALGVAMNFKDANKDTLALAAYDILGYGLFLALGDVKYLAGFDLDTMLVLGEAADDVSKAQKRYYELKGTGAATWLILLKILAEYGPKILEIIKKLREKRRG